VRGDWWKAPNARRDTDKAALGPSSLVRHGEFAHNTCVDMTIAERLLELKHSGQPFVVHLNDGRALRIRAGDYISLNPSGKGTNVTVYGDGEDEEHFIPIFAISSLSVET
jgi:hypothetical protein